MRGSRPLDRSPLSPSQVLAPKIKQAFLSINPAPYGLLRGEQPDPLSVTSGPPSTKGLVLGEGWVHTGSSCAPTSEGRAEQSHRWSQDRPGTLGLATGPAAPPGQPTLVSTQHFTDFSISPSDSGFRLPCWCINNKLQCIA